MHSTKVVNYCATIYHSLSLQAHCSSEDLFDCSEQDRACLQRQKVKQNPKLLVYDSVFFRVVFR